MDSLDIEELNFDEYNRQIYYEMEDPLEEKRSNLLSHTKTFDAQKRYKFEIEKFVSEYKKALSRNEIDESINMGGIKKRKY